MSWRVIRAIFQKDTLDAIKNLYVWISLIMPIGVSLLLGTLFNVDDLGKLTIAVFDSGSSRLVQSLEALPRANVVKVDSLEAVEEAVKREEKEKHTLQMTLSGGAPLGRVGLNLAILIGWAIAIFAAVIWRLRKEENP
jgi:ABC-type transport system involved in multi-copper enzyme maturation permease subunit